MGHVRRHEIIIGSIPKYFRRIKVLNICLVLYFHRTNIFRGKFYLKVKHPRHHNLVEPPETMHHVVIPLGSGLHGDTELRTVGVDDTPHEVVVLVPVARRSPMETEVEDVVFVYFLYIL